MNRLVRSANLLCLTAAAVLASMAFASAQQPTGPTGAPPALAQPGADAPTPVPRGRRGSGLRSACRTDIVQFCSEAAGGAASKRQCLESNLAKVSPTCQTALTQQRQLQVQFRQACRNEMRTLCGEVATGGGAKMRCLRQKSTEVSPQCSEALANLPMGRRGNSGGNRVIAPKT